VIGVTRHILMRGQVAYSIWRPLERDIHNILMRGQWPTLFRDHNSTGWSEWVSDTHPADRDEAGRHAHYTTIPPRYSEGELEIVRADYEIAGSLGVI